MKRPELNAAVEAIFRSHPDLCGFSVHELQLVPTRAVVFDDIAVQPWAGHRPSAELMDELAAALLQVADERPEAAALLAGRTFAPAIH